MNKHSKDANHPMDGMTFGQAVEAIKKGKRVRRRGWADGNPIAYLAKVESEDDVLWAGWEMAGTGQFVLVTSVAIPDILADDWFILHPDFHI